MQQKLSLGTIAEIDGGAIIIAFDNDLAAAIKDCNDRPALSKPRKVMLEVILEPVADSRGDLDVVRIGFRIKSTGPVRESRDYLMEPRAGNVVAFLPDHPEDPKANPLPFDGDRQ